MGARECGSGCERCDPHSTPIREFYKCTPMAEILGKFPPSTHKWVQKTISRSVSPSTPVPSDASSTVVADLQNRIASHSAKLA